MQVKTQSRWTDLTHRIAAEVDAARDLLIADLLRTGQVRQDGWAELVTPFLWQNVVGELLARYRHIKVKLDEEIAENEAHSHHVSALEQDVRNWINSLDLRNS